MSYRHILIAGILFAGLSVIIGAFGAHMLKEILASTGRSETFELAVRYQFYHSLALLAAGLLQKFDASYNLTWAARCFGAGIFLFSGSLFTLSLTGIKVLGAVTPFGGLLFIAGWILFLIQVLRNNKT